MVDALKIGDKVYVGGLVGKISELTSNEEVVVDFGNGTKVTALRNFLTTPPVEKPAVDKSKK
jgi:preprotein translocase subunit YajC